MDEPAGERRRRLPAVDRLLGDPAVVALAGLYGRDNVVIQARALLTGLRTRAGELAPEELEREIASLPGQLGLALAERLGRRLRRVINATGVFVHTNLGRAPLPRDVAAELPELLDAGCDLELDLERGARGDRNSRVEPLLAALTGAEAALVVNNNAAALLLALAAHAAGGEVVVSRGELVEIGGSFRIPDILAASGARLVEVGTTNRTRLADYGEAIGPETRLLLKVFPSNFRIVGFTESASIAELARLARAREVPLLVDEGSGLLRPHPAPQLRDHPSLAELVELGCDLACGSGDKLLGGPQAGILLGRGELVRRCARHPLYRALRPGRPTYALLEATLRRHLAGVSLPLDGMWPPPAAHRRRLDALVAALGDGAGAEVVAADAYLGGGAAPERPIPGEAVAIAADAGLLRRLRAGEPPVVAYARDGRVLLDLRTVDPAADAPLAAAVRAALLAGAE
jgi:L-seryl-tRNA(Ser) seleniumtransferase